MCPFALIRASLKSAPVILLLAAIIFPSPLHGGLISNPSFETSSDWNLSESNPNGVVYGEFTSEWSSEGSRSFRFSRRTGGVQGGTWFQIAQTGVNLTGVTKFVFDCQDTGIDVAPDVFLQLLVDSAEVGRWSNNGHPGGQGGSWGSTATTFDVEIPLSTPLAGTHELAIRLYQATSHSPADAKIYRIDNLRAVVVPEPCSLSIALLALGGVALVRWRRK